MAAFSQKMSGKLNIAVSARIHWGTPTQVGIYQKDHYYIEHSIAHMLTRCGALPLMAPPLRATQGFAPGGTHNVTLADYAHLCDGLVLQGGADVAPMHYGEKARDSAWAGDARRDEYELALIDAFCAPGKPILGICRGMQLLNVYFGGTLHQDIPTDIGSRVLHRDGEIFERPSHAVQIVAGSALAQIYSSASTRMVNTIHHQCVNLLAPNLIAEAHAPDGIVEAFHHRSKPVRGVQWHPELHDPARTDRLSADALVDEFLHTCSTMKLA